MAEALEELTKQVTESLLFDMDFSNILVSGESVASISSVTSTKVGRVDGSADIVLGTPAYNGNIGQIRISGGTFNEQYIITFTFVTNLGNTRVGEGLLRII